MKATTRILPLAGLLATGLLVSAAGNVQAQATAQITAKQFSACYVPSTGTVYLIKQAGLRSECASGHVQFSWSAVGDATAVTPAVVITDPNGWAATGTFGSGAIPVTGPGVRLMWYPRKAALRAGGVPTTQWDDVNIGNYSVALGSGTAASAEAATALGRNTRASGQRSLATGAGSVASGFSSTAMGYTTTASGSISTALGNATTASGSISTALGNATTASSNFATAMGDHAAATSDAATAMGEGTTASGDGSTAMGGHTTASGDFSTAMGDRAAATAVGSTAMGILTTASGSGSTAMGALASTNLRQGSFVYGDFSTSASGALVQATADNSFVVRASGGFRFRTSPDLSTGCDVSGGTLAGNLTCSGTIYSTSGGFRFPDNTVQTTAATGGGAASDVVCTGCVGTSDLANGAVTAPKLGPLSDLVLSGTSAFNGLRIVNSSPTGTERIDFIDATGSTIAGVQVGNTSPSRMAIFNNRPGASVLMATGGLDRLTVTATGSVGIGTSTPASKLTVTGMIESTSGGVKFPDGTVQTRAGAVSGYQVVHVAFNQPK